MGTYTNAQITTTQKWIKLLGTEKEQEVAKTVGNPLKDR